MKSIDINKKLEEANAHLSGTEDGAFMSLTAEVILSVIEGEIFIQEYIANNKTHLPIKFCQAEYLANITSFETYYEYLEDKRYLRYFVKIKWK